MSRGGRYPGVLLLSLHGHEAKEDEGGGRQEQQTQEQVDDKLLHIIYNQLMKLSSVANS
jgi:hypothetical protein